MGKKTTPKQEKIRFFLDRARRHPEGAAYDPETYFTNLCVDRVETIAGALKGDLIALERGGLAVLATPSLAREVRLPADTPTLKVVQHYQQGLIKYGRNELADLFSPDRSVGVSPARSSLRVHPDLYA